MKSRPPLTFAALVSTALLAWLSTPSLSASVVYSNNFNTGTTDWSDNFVKQNASSTTYSWQSTNGVNNTGRVSISGTPSSAYYNTALTGFSPTNTVYTLSAYFLGYPASAAATGFRLGLAGDTSMPLAASGATDSTYIVMGLAATTTGYQWNYRSKSGTDTQLQNTGDTFNLINNDWYKLDITFTFNQATNAFAASGSLWNYGSNGIGTPVLVSSSDLGPIVNAGLAGDSSIYAGFLAGAESGGGARALDNFVVAVPEPGTVSLLVAGLITFAVFGRKRLRQARA